MQVLHLFQSVMHKNSLELEYGSDRSLDSRAFQSWKVTGLTDPPRFQTPLNHTHNSYVQEHYRFSKGILLSYLQYLGCGFFYIILKWNFWFRDRRRNIIKIMRKTQSKKEKTLRSEEKTLNKVSCSGYVEVKYTTEDFAMIS